MILLWGISADGPLASVRAALARRGAPVVFLDQQEILRTEIDTTVDAAVRGTLRVVGRSIALEAVRAVYVRPYDTRRMTEVTAAGQGSPPWEHATRCTTAISSWLEVAPALVVNRLSAMASNDSKPYQASRIREAGFAVPDTLVTTDRDAVTAFHEKHGAVVYKSASGIRSIVSRLGPEHAARLADVASCPTQFQQHVAGTDVRVHTVGDAVFACEIASRADDYRYGAEVSVRAIDLPDELSSRCCALAAALDLAVAGIDLRRTADGRWYCFEVNPSPGFTFYEERTGQPIGEAIAGLLAR